MAEAAATDKTKIVREAVGVFQNPDDLQEAASELQNAGFDLLASANAVREKLGHIYGNALTAEDDPAAPRQAYRSPPDIGDAKGVLIGAPMYVAATPAAR